MVLSRADLGRSIGYKYPHDYENGYIKQQYLPDALKNKIYYEPKTTSKSEQQFKIVYDNLNHKTNKTYGKDDNTSFISSIGFDSVTFIFNSTYRNIF